MSYWESRFERSLVIKQFVLLFFQVVHVFVLPLGREIVLGGVDQGVIVHVLLSLLDEFVLVVIDDHHLLVLVLDFVQVHWPPYLNFDLAAFEFPFLVEIAPVVVEVVGDVFFLHQVQEKAAQVGVVGLVLELEGPAVVKIDRKLDWEMSALYFNGNGHLFLHDLLVLLHLVIGLRQSKITLTPCQGRYPCTR